MNQVILIIQYVDWIFRNPVHYPISGCVYQKELIFSDLYKRLELY